jgi:hypothetical protein
VWEGDEGGTYKYILNWGEFVGCGGSWLNIREQLFPENENNLGW